MTDQQITLPPSRQPLVTDRKQPPAKVTGKVAQAIALMIENGTPWDEAAIEAGLTVRAMRKALAKPHVVKHMKAEREVFRDHVCAANIRRLAQIRDKADNMPAVNAIKALEQIADDPAASSAARHAPGVVIVIQSGAPADRAVTVNAPDICTDKDQ